MEARRCAAGSDISSWTPKAWYSRSRSTAPRFQTKTGSGCYYSPHVSTFHASLICGWTPGYQGRGKEWAEKALGLSVEVVHRTPKPTPEKIARIWAEEWAKEGRKIEWQRLVPRRGFEVLPRRWVAERTFAWLCHNRRMSKDYEKLCASAEAFIYAAMSRLMVRRLARV